MDSFSDAMAAANEALRSGELGGNFTKLKQGLVDLMTLKGPDPAHKDKLTAFKTQVDASIKDTKGLFQSTDKARAKVLVEAAGAGQKKNQRAAALKMVSHLYFEANIGGQQIWVYSPPKAYKQWVFDEVATATNDDQLKAKLAPGETEVYSASQRSVMVNGVQTARAVAQAVQVKLGAASDDTLAVVRRYFGNDQTTKAELLQIIEKLASGYKKIAAACNAGNIIISDEPGDRSGDGWQDWAFVYHTEAMSVIYLQGAWLKKAGQISSSNTAPLYRCVRTIIHELSHKEISTEDIVYGWAGLMPQGSSSMTPEYALHNADSWAYFAIDVLGHLTGSDKANGRTPTTAIRKTPSRVLTLA